jgi:hypothetical protein
MISTSIEKDFDIRTMSGAISMPNIIKDFNYIVSWVVKASYKQIAIEWGMSRWADGQMCRWADGHDATIDSTLGNEETERWIQTNL